MSRHSIANVLTEFNVADNPVIFTVLCLITAADLLMICYNKFRGHRRVLRRGRDAVKRRKEARKAARDKAKSKSDEDATVLAERKRRKLEKMGENAKREEMEKEKKKHAKHPPIQDRVFLDLLRCFSGLLSILHLLRSRSTALSSPRGGIPRGGIPRGGMPPSGSST